MKLGEIGKFMVLGRSGLMVLGIALISGLISLALITSAAAQDGASKLITVHDRGVTATFVTQESTLKAALADADIALDARDTVEPSLEEELVADSYQVNIYRARPVVVIDGMTRLKTMTPYQTVQQIAKDAGLSLYREDTGSIERSNDLVGEGAGLQLTIKRAIPIVLDLYGKTTEVRTQGRTVAAMLNEKGIELGHNGRVSLPAETAITAGLQVRVWREGKQTITTEEAIPYETEMIFDADREVGYRQIQTPGVAGVKSLTYEVDIRDGVELSRLEIAQIVTKNPTKQVEAIGIKPGPNALTKSKGAQYFTDSKGVSHRETYYDLPMNVVMQACGQGGYYTVRPGDGAKVDRDGYVIIAANYGNYPRCSIVETSMGPGKVYDTGGFAARHPHGFDLATDWTNNNGR